jgi:hypothetical protein
VHQKEVVVVVVVAACIVVLLSWLCRSFRLLSIFCLLQFSLMSWPSGSASQKSESFFSAFYDF